MSKLNKVTLTLTNGDNIDTIATIVAEVPEDGHTQVSIVEHCLAKAPSLQVGPKGYTVEYAKDNYTVVDTAIFSFENFEDTDGIHKEFGELLKENPELDREDVLAAAVFLDILGEILCDIDDEQRTGTVALVSTILERVENAR